MVISNETFFSILVSVAATWFFAWLYYRRSGRDIDAATIRLAAQGDDTKRGINALARALEKGGVPTFTYDRDGNLAGILIEARAELKAVASCKATGTVTYGAPIAYDRQHEQPPEEDAPKI